MSTLLGRILRPCNGIYVVNSSTLASIGQVRAWTQACAVQLARDVAPAYGRAPVRVQYLDSPIHAPRGSWVIAMLDDADQADALGYHSQDGAGRVYGRVFLRPCLEYQVPASTTLSHEIIETYCDPTVDRWASSGAGFTVAYEACDPVESDQYMIDGIAVSDFVYPAWFHSHVTRGRFSHGGSVAGPFEVAAGGYMVRRWPDGSEDQSFGTEARRSYIQAKRHQLSRTSRRTGSP